MPITCHFAGLYTVRNNSLGNHLFQIASVIGLSKDNNDIATFPEIVQHKKHWNEEILNELFKNLNTFDFQIENTFSEPDGTHKKRLNFEYKNNMQLFGYYQSYKYFDKYRLEIQKIFEPSNITKNYLINKYKLNDTISVGLHIRRGDYVDIGITLNLDYYNKALNYIKQKIGSNKDFTIYVFSDDIEWCKKNLKYNNCIFSEESICYDLYLMSLCTHNIIANSTFSWWGAYLNQNTEKIVIYPTVWAKFKNIVYFDIDDFFCKDWIGL